MCACVCCMSVHVCKHRCGKRTSERQMLQTLLYDVTQRLKLLSGLSSQIPPAAKIIMYNYKLIKAEEIKGTLDRLMIQRVPEISPFYVLTTLSFLFLFFPLFCVSRKAFHIFSMSPSMHEEFEVLTAARSCLWRRGPFKGYQKNQRAF